MKRIAVIAGAGPAGLTAGLELLRRSDVTPMIFETEGQLGGISRTVDYRGNRMDLGGHRFFSKSDWVMRWWQEILPIRVDRTDSDEPTRLTYQRQSHDLNVHYNLAAPDTDAVMLVRRRLSRIFHRRRFFDYPLKLNAGTLRSIGLLESLKIALSYGQAQLRFPRSEETLEDFFINRFGDRLYRTFFKDYTEKVWGVSCNEISAEWGAQRIKGLSVTKAIAHGVVNLVRRPMNLDARQRRIETSLIEKFLYPKLGPGQMWEEVGRQIILRGGHIRLKQRIVGILRQGALITAIEARDEVTGEVQRIPCDYFVSTMPIVDLISQLNPEDRRVAAIAANLPYRDFVTVGLLLRRMKRTSCQQGHLENGMPPDNWIYVQEPDVKVGRIQVFNNWSPALVADPTTIWLGLEYFCAQGDGLWSMDDAKFIDFAAGELEQLGMLDPDDVIDGTVVRVPKAYPAYLGEYREFGRVRDYLDEFTNLYPIGRNGMHRYNNQDHSMLAANAAVNSMLDHGRGKSEIWNINTEDDYHEEKGPQTVQSEMNLLGEE